VDDRERAEFITDFVASQLDAAWLHQRCGTPREMRLSPAVFRYQLIQRAQQANKRIVLPEGSEPLPCRPPPSARPAASPAACCWPSPKRCKPWRAPRASPAAGAGSLDPDLIRERYVEPMVDLRKSKNLNAPMAEQQLEDPW
jgi:phosphate acetyltransferase